MDCQICTEKYNKSNHQCIQCEYCDFKACRTCYESYINCEGTAVCMNKEKDENNKYLCNKEWTRYYVARCMTKDFMKKNYNIMTAKHAIDVQNALLPETVQFANAENKVEEIYNQIREIQMAINNLKKQRRLLEMSHYRQLRIVRGDVNRRDERVVFVRKCPGEDCRGFLTSAWKCGLCALYTCHKCHVITGTERDVEHTCDPELLATAELLSKDTKQCPKCSEGIFKIDGCDQMWCTQCHTAFNWRTGRIENIVHNPHYYEYLRNTTGTVPRNAGDEVCGDNFNQNLMHVFMMKGRDAEKMIAADYDIDRSSDFNEYNDQFTTLIKVPIIVEGYRHLTRIEMVRYTDTGNEQSKKLRILYLRKKITDTVFKSRISRNLKAQNKNREIHAALTLWSTVVGDIVTRATGVMKGNNVSNVEVLCNAVTEVEEITVYANNLLNDVGKTYAVKQKQIFLERPFFV